MKDKKALIMKDMSDWNESHRDDSCDFILDALKTDNPNYI